MIKVMVVDDEAIEREALTKIIERGIEDVQVVGQADNGIHAIQLARELEPDLILMDIQMPGLNGLEAIQQIQAQQPQIKYVIVTAYDTFDYARQALQLSVKDYLLKPSKTQEIVDMLQKVVHKIEQEKHVLRRHADEQRKLQHLQPVVEADLVTQLLFDHIHDIHVSEMLKMMSGDTAGSLFVIVVNVAPVLKPSDGEATVSRDTVIPSGEVYRAMKEQIRASASAWIGPMSAWQIPVIVFGDALQTYRSQAATIVRRLIQLSHTLRDYRLFIGIGGQYPTLEEVRSSYHEALLASASLDLPAKHSFYEASKEHVNEPIVVALVEKQMIEEARRGNWLNVDHELLQVIHHYETAGAAVLATQQKVYELLFVLSRFMLEMGVRVAPLDVFAQASSYQQLKTKAIDCVQAMAKAFSDVKNQLAPDTMQIIKQYIREHAHEDISLEAVAEQVRLSPFYVSKMFKEQFGANYIDYLTECRIDKAKQLLGDPDKSLKEIAFEVGYNDPNYFSRVFKKVTDLSPSDYRKELIMKKRL